MKMSCKRMSRVLFHMPRQELLDMAERIRRKYSVCLVKPVEKILVMANVEERLKGTKFHLGEILASEALVQVEGTLGRAVFMGSDYEKTLAAAVIDGTFNANLMEIDGMEEVLLRCESDYELELRREEAVLKKSRVEFQTMNKAEEYVKKTSV
jgi:alpha-D-ribose 1-methylphosphonate 5-triphosphate synthase subunit PhnG